MAVLFDTTICAPATPSGKGAVAMIRVSGPDALEIVDSVFVPKNGKTLSESGGYTLHFGTIYDGEEPFDDVLVSVFRSPSSYTGENSAEISCHGSEFIVGHIIELLLKNGAVMASPGEFTQRAFVNGKMDLAQAEAVSDVIETSTASAHRIAMNQMKGGFSKELASMREQLLHIVSLMELELDFSDEEVEFADRSELHDLVENVIRHTDRLMASFKMGNVIKNGVPVAIVGATNTGKSTLLNAILGEERAIVSPIHGTTRDFIEDTININGVLFRFIDTAGIRKTRGAIENIGIERTFEKISKASVVILMLDATRPDQFENSIKTLAEHIDRFEQTVVIVVNKCDALEDKSSAASVSSPDGIIDGPVGGLDKAAASVLNSSDGVLSRISGRCQNADGSAFNGLLSQINVLSASSGLRIASAQCMSAMTGRGVTTLLNTLSSLHSEMVENASESTLLTNLRHYEAIRNANAALLRVRDGLASRLSTDLVSQDIREVLYHIGSIVGEISTDEVLGEIFGKFCIGK